MKLRNLDILRACLALMVLLGHARGFLWMPWHEWKELPHSMIEKSLALSGGIFKFGTQAVSVFFALSGFFIHLRAAKQASAPGGMTGFSASDFLYRRSKRILPPYYVALLFTLLLDVIGHTCFPKMYAGMTGHVVIDTNQHDAGYSMAAVVPALFAQPNLFGIPFGSNGPLWSIGYEIFYYALYPVFMWLWLRSRFLGYGVALGVSICCWFWPVAGWWSSMLSSYPMWLAGAMLAELMSAKRGVSTHALWFWGMLAMGIGGLALTLSSLPVQIPWLSVPVSMMMGIGMIGAFEAMPEFIVRHRLGRALEWLGIRSYSVYIFHMPVQLLICAWLFQSYGRLPSHGWIALGGALVSLGAGLAGFYLVERHFLPKRVVI